MIKKLRLFPRGATGQQCVVHPSNGAGWGPREMGGEGKVQIFKQQVRNIPSLTKKFDLQ